LIYGPALLILFCSLNAQGAAVALIMALLGYVHQQSGPVRLGRLYSAAEARVAQGSLSEAVEILRQIQAEMPTEALCQALARCHLAQNDVAGVVDEFGRFEALGGQLSPPSILAYAAALGTSGHADRGLERVESLPGSPAGDTCRIAITGNLLLKMGRAAQAIEVLKQAPLRQRKPDTTLTHVRLLLADAYAASGQRAKALATYRRVYADDPDLEDVRDRINQLESEPARKMRRRPSSDITRPLSPGI
jgi:tetratricopeptide (TPR) repeat protein